MSRSTAVLITFLMMIGLAILASSFQTSKPQQFFVEGYVAWNYNKQCNETLFNITIGYQKYYYTNRQDMIRGMNNLGFKAVSISFNTYRNEGYEIYIFQ